MKRRAGVRVIPIELVRAPKTGLKEPARPEAVTELARSIRKKGLQKPIVVSRRGKGYEVVSGYRRLLALIAIGADTVEAVVHDVPGEEMVSVRARKNLERGDLTKLETARLLGEVRLLEGLSIKAIAKKVGKDKMTVWRYLKLLEVPEDYHVYIERGNLGIMAAVAILRVKDPMWRGYLFDGAISGRVTEREAIRWSEEFRGVEKGHKDVLDGLWRPKGMG